MREEAARSVLRLVAVITVPVGLILMTTYLVLLTGLDDAVRSASPGIQVRAVGSVAQLGPFVVLMFAPVVVWGVVLYALSPMLARHLVR